MGGGIGEENVPSVLWEDWRRKCTLCALGRLAKKNVLSVPWVDHLSKKMYSLSPGEIGEEYVLSLSLSAPWGDWRRKCTLCALGRSAKKMYSPSPGKIGKEYVLSAPRGNWRRKCTLCALGRLAKKMYSLRSPPPRQPPHSPLTSWT